MLHRWITQYLVLQFLYHNLLNTNFHTHMLHLPENQENAESFRINQEVVKKMKPRKKKIVLDGEMRWIHLLTHILLYFKILLYRKCTSRYVSKGENGLTHCARSICATIKGGVSTHPPCSCESGDICKKKRKTEEERERKNAIGGHFFAFFFFSRLNQETRRLVGMYLSIYIHSMKM